MSKPILRVVLLHGAWHGPHCWDPLTAELDKAGYSSVAPALPSTGVVPPVPDYSQDVDVIRKAVEDLVREHDIVVVMHSYSGLPGGTALEGLDKQTCVSKGLKGGVIRLIFICAFLVPEGFQYPLTSNSSTGIVTVRPEDAKFMFYQDLDEETVAELAKDLQPQSVGAFWSTVPTTFAAWRYIPSTYIICTEDRPSTILASQYMIDGAIASGKHKIDSVIRVDTGHSPFVSRPEWTVETLIREAAREA
ncbi:hypothetical protein VMCG_09926 [Cytospora schulzeri]|uniref:AB hydrolase-1 domain-containing protein n=1 Tax=Cytospora schulzeri TaxID=448051 RepID=A0A423VF15_9PEZI|nr:hypothetical protein VMCG_09926 [Valsa malicola]